MIVMDATAAVKVLTREPGADAALARIVAEEHRIAPDWLRLEVANALSKKVRNDGLSEHAALAALSALDNFVTGAFSAVDLLDEAFALSLRLNHAVYDCLYLALAIRHDVVVVSHDEQFIRRAERAGCSANVELLA